MATGLGVNIYSLSSFTNNNGDNCHYILSDNAQICESKLKIQDPDRFNYCHTKDSSGNSLFSQTGYCLAYPKEFFGYYVLPWIIFNILFHIVTLLIWNNHFNWINVQITSLDCFKKSTDNIPSESSERKE